MANTSYRSQGMELIVSTSDVRVAEITLGPNADTPEHGHTAAEEVCYCLEGVLSCECEGEEPVVLRAGEKKRIAAGVGHRLRNEGDVPCRFLLVHGVGRFDFVGMEKG